MDETEEEPQRGPHAEFGQRIIDLRPTVGIENTSQLAVKVKIKQPTMRAIEFGYTDPERMETGTFMRLIDALHTNPHYLLKGVGPMGPLINPSTDEGEAASLSRALRKEYREAWMAAGNVFRRMQKPLPPSTDAPFVEDSQDQDEDEDH